MINYIKNLFSKQVDNDPNLTVLRKNFDGSYRGLNDAEQAVLMLRLTGMSKAGVCRALDLSEKEVYNIELTLLKKLTK